LLAVLPHGRTASTVAAAAVSEVCCGTCGTCGRRAAGFREIFAVARDCVPRLGS